MDIQDIVIHVDATALCRSRLRLAANLAHRFGTYLIGICAADSVPAEERFSILLAEENLAGKWRPVIGLFESEFARLARAVDLAIVGQYDPYHSSELDAPENVILACGRPILVVPHEGEFDRIGDTVVVAWNGTREAQRAVQDALPLLATSASVSAIEVAPESKAQEEGARRCTRPSSEAVWHRCDAGDTEKQRPQSCSADDGAGGRSWGTLIVMGAYGHSRLRETILGGMTRDMLKTMALPVLMSH